MPSPWMRIAGWAVTLAAVAVYVYMLTTTLPHLAELAGGMAMFDMRSGYDLDTARAILAALGDDGRRYYDAVQHRLDSFYPPLVALTVVYWLWRLAPRWRRTGWPLPNAVLLSAMAIAALAAVCDLTENALVGGMLATGPDGLDAATVALASGFTLAKTVAVSVSQTALLVLIVAPFVPRLLARKD
jgi:hypothetical protein